MKNHIAIVGSIILILGAGGILLSLMDNESVTTNTSPQTPLASEAELVESGPQSPNEQNVNKYKTISSQSIASAAAAYSFTAEIPAGWEAESVSGSEAISFYDPSAAGTSTLERSQIFMRYFTANSFLTLSTVTIHSSTSLEFNGRPAVRYDIEKKPGITNFPNQPSWRSQRHFVTDIRASNSNPSVFYVIARRPDLSAETYEHFLQSFDVEAGTSTSLQEPIAEFNERITKKPFGIFITPENSPVSPERFTGYHTGVDIEYADVTSKVPIYAIAPGTVRIAQTASGYGGVVIIEHVAEGKQFTALYGHLDPISLPAVGAEVISGEQIAVLGEGNTSETDFERKHLHFAIFNSTQLNLRGYVQTESELSAWRDPQTLF